MATHIFKNEGNMTDTEINILLTKAILISTIFTLVSAGFFHHYDLYKKALWFTSFNIVLTLTWICKYFFLKILMKNIGFGEKRVSNDVTREKF